MPAQTEYENLFPSLRYSPWNLDNEFIQIYDKIYDSTLVDKCRCYELWTLVEQTAKLKGSLIEVGVWRGGTGALIAKKANMTGGEKIYLCDNFKGVIKASPKDKTYKGGEHNDSSIERVKDLLNKCEVINTSILCGVFPDETAAGLQDTFKFCHIDVDTYQSAKDVQEWIWPRLVTGGIIVHDDYGIPGVEGITKYINEQLGDPDKLIIYNLNGHGVIIKL